MWGKEKWEKKTKGETVKEFEKKEGGGGIGKVGGKKEWREDWSNIGEM